MIQSPISSGPYLAPVENPRHPLMKLAYYFMRKQFGKVAGPASVFSARMPFAFTTFYMKVNRLDKKLKLPKDLLALIREQVATTNGCLFCMDAGRWAALRGSVSLKEKFDSLGEYRTSPLFSEAERAALDYVTEVTLNKHAAPESFDRLARYLSEREICEVAWLIASEHLYNMSNNALNIGSDGMCEIPR